MGASESDVQSHLNPACRVVTQFCIFYTARMIASRRIPKATLTIRIGSWFEARATGWGVAAVPLSLILALVAHAVEKLL